MVKVAILEYGIGNIHSLARGLEQAGAEVLVTAQADQAIAAEALVLPAAGAFVSAAERIAAAASALRGALQAGLPCLAIGLGMHLLFESSEEAVGAGLGVVPGVVRRLGTSRVPHSGWNRVVAGPDPFLGGHDITAWFAHTYVTDPREPRAIIGWVEHETQRFPAAVRAGRTIGVQFRPEKSGAAGVALLRAFVRDAA